MKNLIVLLIFVTPIFANLPETGIFPNHEDLGMTAEDYYFYMANMGALAAYFFWRGL